MSLINGKGAHCLSRQRRHIGKPRHTNRSFYVCIVLHKVITRIVFFFLFSCATNKKKQIFGPKLKSDWFVRSPLEPYSFSMRYGVDKGFFHRDNFAATRISGNPWGFLYPGGKVQSPTWQSDEGIGATDITADIGDIRVDSMAYEMKLQHNHPELKWDTKPTPWGEFDFDYSSRMGMMGVKVGHTTQIDDFGNMFNAAIIWCPDQHILNHFTRESDGRCGMTLACYNSHSDRPSGLKDACAQAGISQKKHSKSFKISEDAYIPVGTKMDVRHFVPGQLVCIITTKPPGPNVLMS